MNEKHWWGNFPGAAIDFVGVVGGNKEWDYKRHVSKHFDDDVDVFFDETSGKYHPKDMLGNINYGFVAPAAGYFGFVADLGVSLVAIKDGTNAENWDDKLWHYGPFAALKIHRI